MKEKELLVYFSHSCVGLLTVLLWHYLCFLFAICAFG